MLFLFGELAEERVSGALGRVAGLLEFFKECNTSLVFGSVANVESGLTFAVSREEVELQVLGEVVKNLIIAVKGCDMQQVVVVFILAVEVSSLSQECLEAVKVLITLGNSEHQWSESSEFLDEGGWRFSTVFVMCLLGWHFEVVLLYSLQYVLK